MPAVITSGTAEQHVEIRRWRRSPTTTGRTFDNVISQHAMAKQLLHCGRVQISVPTKQNVTDTRGYSAFGETERQLHLPVSVRQEKEYYRDSLTGRSWCEGGRMSP
jgi:hypothetical protein